MCSTMLHRNWTWGRLCAGLMGSLTLVNKGCELHINDSVKQLTSTFFFFQWTCGNRKHSIKNKVGCIIPLTGCVCKENGVSMSKDMQLLHWLQHYSCLSGYGGHWGLHWCHWIKIVSLCRSECYSARKGRSSAVSDNLEGVRDVCVWWNKPGPERQVLCDLMDTWALEIISEEQSIGWCLPESWKSRRMGDKRDHRTENKLYLCRSEV